LSVGESMGLNVRPRAILFCTVVIDGPIDDVETLRLLPIECCKGGYGVSQVAGILASQMCNL
jgi:hypothetical protein